MAQERVYVSPQNLKDFLEQLRLKDRIQFAWKTEIPTQVSELANDMNYQSLDNVNRLIAESLASVFVFKGSVPTKSDLPASDNKIGDVWHVVDTEEEYAWTGDKWESLGNSKLDWTIATVDKVGVVKPDGITISIDSEGTISCTNEHDFLTDEEIDDMFPEWVGGDEEDFAFNLYPMTKPEVDEVFEEDPADDNAEATG